MTTHATGAVDASNVALARSGALTDQVPTAPLNAAGLSAMAGQVRVQLPARASGDITLTSSQGVLRVGLPVSDAMASASQAGSATFVYRDPGMDRDVAAQAVEDGSFLPTEITWRPVDPPPHPGHAAIFHGAQRRRPLTVRPPAR